MNSPSDATAHVKTFSNVIHKKVEGTLSLSSDAIAFQPTDDDNTNNFLSIPWSDIAKHQVSPASHAKAMLKLLSTDGKSTVFQFRDRTDLETCRKEISERLQQIRNGFPSSSSSAMVTSPTAPTTPNNSNGMSGKKRSHSEINNNGNNNANNNANNNNNGSSSNKFAANSFGDLDPSALAVARSSVLAANPTLRAQHQYLVQETNTVSEEDFWKTHQDMIEEEFARINGMTRAGTSSLLQSHLQLLTGRVTLGVEEMRQIFILYPAVHKAYEEKVPLELSDEQFWRKYLESEYFHRDRGRIGAASRGNDSADKGKKSKNDGKSVEEQEARAAAVGTDDLFSRYAQKLKEQTNDPHHSNNRKWGTQLAVGQFDLASTFETERGQLLEGPKDNHPNGNDDGKGSRVIQKYNRHWAMVLHPEEAVAGSDLLQVARKSITEVVPDDTDAMALGGLDTEMSRLVGFASATSEEANHASGKGKQDLEDYEELTLKNIEVYYSGKSTNNNATASKDPKAIADLKKRNEIFAQSMIAKVQSMAARITTSKGITTTFENSFPPPQLGKELLSALTKKMAKDSKTDADALEVVNAIPEEFKRRLHIYFRRSSELLRHFFGLRKLAEQSPQHYNSKLKRIVQGMETVYREMEGMRKDEIEQTEIGETMRKICLQIMDQLDWAFKLHREGSGGGGGGGFVTIEEF